MELRHYGLPHQLVNASERRPITFLYSYAVRKRCRTLRVRNGDFHSLIVKGQKKQKQSTKMYALTHMRLRFFLHEKLKKKNEEKNRRHTTTFVIFTRSRHNYARLHATHCIRHVIYHRQPKPCLACR